MAIEASERHGMPRSVMITPVVMLLLGVAASIGLWMLLNQDPPRMVRADGTGLARLHDPLRAKP